MLLCCVVAHLVTACLPEAKGACLGQVGTGTPEWERIAAEAARTVPGRGKNREREGELGEQPLYCIQCDCSCTDLSLESHVVKEDCSLRSC